MGQFGRNRDPADNRGNGDTTGEITTSRDLHEGDFVYADSTDENGNNITVFGKITNILIEEILT
jgi:hypothetical protein